MLPPAILNVADRLIIILMTLVDAVSPIALDGSTPTFPEHAAHTLFFRLSRLVATLIQICIFGTRARPTPKARIQPAPLSERPSPHPAQRFPSRPGWLLAALPDIAPAVAADLAALLADPAFAPLFAAAPTLHRMLRPLLRSLGLTQPPLPDPPPPPPPPHSHPEPLPPARPAPTPGLPSDEPRRTDPTSQHHSHAHFVTI